MVATGTVDYNGLKDTFALFLLCRQTFLFFSPNPLRIVYISSYKMFVSLSSIRDDIYIIR